MLTTDVENYPGFVDGVQGPELMTIMQERAFKNDKIEFRWDSVVDEVLGDSKVSGLRLRNVKNDEVSALDVTGVFVAIGHAPNTDLFRGHIALDDAGYILTHDGTNT